MSETAERVRSTILEHIGKMVPDTTQLVDEIGLDSLEVAELILTIEDRLEVGIPNEAVEGFITIGDVIEYVSGLVDGVPNRNLPSP
jgi:acyl carrier protein